MDRNSTTGTLTMMSDQGVRSHTGQCSSSPHFHRTHCKRGLAQSPYFSSKSSSLPSPVQVAVQLSPDSTFDSFVRKRREACDVFRKRWDNYQDCHQRNQDNFGLRFHTCVRHLCSQKCYLHAYAPYREWYAVCKEVHGSPMEKVLKDEQWKCVWATEKGRAPQSSPMMFVNCYGTRYHFRVRFFQYLKDKSRGSSARKRLFQEESVYNATKIQHQQLSYINDDQLISPPDSPYGLLEELFVNDPWKLLISAIFLNRTCRRIVDPILYEFFQAYPTAEAIVTEPCVDRIAFLIQPLGFHKRRSNGIVAFSTAFLALRKRKPFRLWTPNDIKGMYHCGQYASDVFRLFYLREWGSMNSTCDHALTIYLAYQRERDSLTR